MPFQNKYDYVNPFDHTQCIYGVYYHQACMYIGSTDDMRKRYKDHVGSRYNANSPMNNYQLYKVWREVNLTDFKFKILDVFTEVLNRKAREKIEQSYIDSEKPLSNGQNAFTDRNKYNEQNRKRMKKYHQKNKDKKKQYNKKYREKNRDVINAKQNLRNLEIRLFKQLPQDF